MSRLVDIDGRIVAPEDAVVSVFDRGFLYGDSVYEVLRTYQGRPFATEAHLGRLERSAARIGLTLPWPAGRLATEVDRVLAAADDLAEGHESYVRIVVTRGAGPIGLDPGLAEDPRTILIVQPLHQPPRALYEAGAAVAVVGVERNRRAAVDPAAKTGNYLNSVLALREARGREADEAVMLDAGGHLTEGASSNVFLVRGGRLCTPALDVGILEGVTRATVLALARETGVEVDEGPLTAGDLARADEAFLTSTIREILPVTRVDGAQVGEGRPGPVTRRLQAAFRARVGAPVDGARF